MIKPPKPQNPKPPNPHRSSIGWEWKSVAFAVVVGSLVGISGACSPKPDENIQVECQFPCDAGDSNIQCLLKIDEGLLDKERWEITCADLSHPTDKSDAHQACETACGNFDNGTNATCIETVKDLGPDPKPIFEPYQCVESGYVGTDGLPEPDDDDGAGVGDGLDESGASAPSWDPGAYITYNQSLDVYIIDEELVDAVKAEPTLLALDGAYLEQRATSGFEFKRVTTGTLPDLLGIANGDVTRSLNGHGLNDMQDAMEALAAVSDSTSLSFSVNRGGTIVSLDYLIR